MGTHSGGDDVLRRETRGEELRPVGAGQIEERPGGAVGAPDMGRVEFCGDLFADLVAARSDAGPDQRFHALGAAAVFEDHASDRVSDDLGGGAAPAGVYGGDGADGRVDEQDGAAVGGSDAEQAIRLFADEGVAAERRVDGVGGFRDAPNDVGVDLAKEHWPKVVGAELAGDLLGREVAEVARGAR